MNSNSQRIQDFLDKFGISSEIKELSESTRTSAEAAKAIGCDVSQIAKSILFKTKTGKPILVIASGSNRINEKRIEEEIGERIEKAAADFVKDKTGFAIGGVPPFGHIEKIKEFIDKDLIKYDKIWAAAGTPHSVFSLTPEQLIKITKAMTIDIV